MSHPYHAAVASLEPAKRVGSVRSVSPGRIEAAGPLAMVGDICEIARAAHEPLLLAEVISVFDDRILLSPLDQAVAIAPHARIVAQPWRARAEVGDRFAGRAIDPFARPIDGGDLLPAGETAPLDGHVLAALDRQEPDKPLETGVRTIDGLLTIGRGQRVGLFSASGVGKTTLMRQLALQIQADRCVLCLVGERGREVESIWRDIAASPTRARYTCVAATSDVSAPLRVRAVNQAVAIAEYWRGQGEHVVLIVDSVTRYAMALRELGLAAGAPPTLRAYTPNVFAALPRLVERCGAAKAGGSITAIMTVLAETDDVDDPIVEIMKSLLDGHIVLSRTLAEQGHYPAIDVIRSVSRLADQLVSPSHGAAARRAVALLATYDEARLMIESGLYKPGNDRVDEAIRQRPALNDFLKQAPHERTPLSETTGWLEPMLSKGARYA